nr:CidA/LrgA family protein [Nocardioides marinus]
MGCQLAGEVLAHATGAPVPGAVLGMVVLLVVLLVRRREDTSAHVAADALLPHLQLLFIVPGVGVVAYGAVIAADWLPIVVALVGSWVLGLATIGLSAQALTRWAPRSRGRAAGGPR